MNSYRNNHRKNRFKPNSDRGFRKRSLNGHKGQNDFSSNLEFRHRNQNRNSQNAAKLIDKYNNLAREALSSGDKILSENYLQHADHFTRILNEKESFKRDKITESKSEKNSVIKNQNVEDSDLNSNEDLVEESSDETNVQKNTKYQVEIN